MKKVMTVLAICAVLSASFAMADGDTNIDVGNTNNVTATGGNASAYQTQGQTQGQQQQINNNVVVPSALPVAQLPNVGLPNNQTGEYGHHSTQLSIQATASIFCGMTRSEISTMISVKNKHGRNSWKDTNSDIISHPYVKKTFASLGTSEKIYMITGNSAMSITQSARVEQIAGLWVYNSENDKNVVLPPDLQLQMALDAADIGANVIIALDQFDPRTYSPDSFGWSAGGVMSWLSKCFLAGQSISAGVGGTSGKGRMYVNPGAAFLLLRVEGLTDEVCYQTKVTVAADVCDPSGIWARINELKQGVKNCTRWCYNNLTLRNQLGDAFIDLYVCTGDKRYLQEAAYHFDMAEKNFKKGYDIAAHRNEAQQIIAHSYYAWSGVINLTQGRTSAMNFAHSRNLERIPDGFSK